MIFNATNASNFVHAYNHFSCSVASVLSVCYDAGILKKISETDEYIVKNEKFYEYFPHWNPNHWDKKPGVLNNGDIIRLAEKLGLTSEGRNTQIENLTINDLKTFFERSDVIGILILTHVGSDGKLWEHCFKLAKILNDTFYLMNPSTNSEQIERYSSDEIKNFKPKCIVFTK